MSGISPQRLEEDFSERRSMNLYGGGGRDSVPANQVPNFEQLIADSEYRICDVRFKDRMFSFDLDLDNAGKSSRIHCFAITPERDQHLVQLSDFSQVRMQFYNADGNTTYGDSVIYDLDSSINPKITQIFAEAFATRPNDGGDSTLGNGKPLKPIGGPGRTLSRDQLRKFALAI